MDKWTKSETIQFVIVILFLTLILNNGGII